MLHYLLDGAVECGPGVTIHTILRPRFVVCTAGCWRVCTRQQPAWINPITHFNGLMVYGT